MADGPAPIEQNVTPRPKWVEKIGTDGKPINPDIKNSYGNLSEWQVTVNGKVEGKWQYAISNRLNPDATYPRGRFLMINTSKTSDGEPLIFNDVDRALDFAMEKNRENLITQDGKKGYIYQGKFYEMDVYDPREKQEEQKTT